MSEKRYAIAIDGPSGAGKSTLARAAAKALGILYVDTGAIYRTVGLCVRQRGVEPADQPAVEALLRNIHIEMCYGEDGLQRMFLCGTDVTDAIRLPEVSVLASKVSAIPSVRDFLLEMQRDMARRQSVIMDGRDIGTVVLPEAEVKIYLTGPAGGTWSSSAGGRLRTSISSSGRLRSGTCGTRTAPSPPCVRRRTPSSWIPQEIPLSRASRCC